MGRFCAVRAPGRWDNYPEGRYQWVRLEEMSGFTELLARFVLRLRAERLLPLPGDVFCLVAGPPCQNMSGFNQFANKIEVMKDTKNRIVLSVLSIVEHLRPPFALLEQVRWGHGVRCCCALTILAHVRAAATQPVSVDTRECLMQAVRTRARRTCMMSYVTRTIYLGPLLPQ